MFRNIAGLACLTVCLFGAYPTVGFASIIAEFHWDEANPSNSNGEILALLELPSIPETTPPGVLNFTLTPVGLAEIGYLSFVQFLPLEMPDNGSHFALSGSTLVSSSSAFLLQVTNREGHFVFGPNDGDFVIGRLDTFINTTGQAALDFSYGRAFSRHLGYWKVVDKAPTVPEPASIAVWTILAVVGASTRRWRCYSF